METEKQVGGHVLDWDSSINETAQTEWQPPGDQVGAFAERVGAIEPEAKPEENMDEAARKPVLVDMSTVAPTPVRWLWPGRVARGRLSLLVGRAGLGKSFLTIDMAMRVTTGFGWPDGTTCPTGTVLFICCEDDPGDTIRPRLDAAGADAGKVRLLKGVNFTDPKTGENIESTFTLQDVIALESALKSMPDCQLVIIDPIGSYLGGGTDSHRDNEVRGVLAPISALAEKYGPAVVIVAHTRKSSAKYADDTALGSRAFTGIVRTSWHLMADEKDAERKLFLPGKNNLAKTVIGARLSDQDEQKLSDRRQFRSWPSRLGCRYSRHARRRRTWPRRTNSRGRAPIRTSRQMLKHG